MHNIRKTYNRVNRLPRPSTVNVSYSYKYGNRIRSVTSNANVTSGCQHTLRRGKRGALPASVDKHAVTRLTDRNDARTMADVALTNADLNSILNKLVGTLSPSTIVLSNSMIRSKKL